MKPMGLSIKVFQFTLFFLFAGIFSPLQASSSCVDTKGQTPDMSDLSIDGPYVFYKKDKVVVKSIEVEDAQYRMVANEYPSRDEVPTLECVIDNKRRFNINLQEKISSPPSEYPQPDKLFAISDIEGNFHAFAKTLIGNGVIDENFQWSYGDGHLVLVGDFFDRGLNVTACLWLIYALEAQAAAQGGMVHFILGNHEEMNLSGDYRYVRNKYQTVAKKLNCTYEEMFDNNTELGRWLRSKNMIEKIGETIYVHAGLSPQIAGCKLSLERINKICHAHIGKKQDELQDKGASVSLVFAKSGPLWYRGFFGGKLEEATVATILDRFGAKHVVVGHTIVDEITTLHNGRVVAIDVKHSDHVANARPNALLVEDGRFYKVNYKGSAQPVEEAGGKKPDVSTVAFKAIRENNLLLLKTFIRNGNDVNSLYSSKKYPLLHYAIEFGSLEAVGIILGAGGDTDQFFDGKTALMHAIKHKKKKSITLLLESDVDVNIQNHRQQTALFYVSRYGNATLAKQLVSHGARADLIDQSGVNAFQFAVKNSNVAVAQFLKSLKN